MLTTLLFNNNFFYKLKHLNIFFYNYFFFIWKNKNINVFIFSFLNLNVILSKIIFKKHYFFFTSTLLKKKTKNFINYFSNKSVFYKIICTKSNSNSLIPLNFINKNLNNFLFLKINFFFFFFNLENLKTLLYFFKLKKNTNFIIISKILKLKSNIFLLF